MFRATAQKALKSAASRLTPRGGLVTKRNMSGGGSIEEEIGKKKSIASSLLSPTTIRSLSSLFDDDRYSLALLSLTKNRIILITRKALLLLMRLLYSFYFVLRVESQLVLSSSFSCFSPDILFFSQIPSISSMMLMITNNNS